MKRYQKGINSPLPVTVWRKGQAEECDPPPFVPLRCWREGRGERGTRADSDCTGSIAETEGVAPDHPPCSRPPHTHIDHLLVQTVTLEFHYRGLGLIFSPSVFQVVVLIFQSNLILVDINFLKY